MVNQYDILAYAGDEVTFRGQKKDDVVEIDGTIYAKRGADIIVEPVDAAKVIMILTCGVDEEIYSEDECIINNFNGDEKEYTPKTIAISVTMGRNIAAGETVAEVKAEENIHTNYGTIILNNGVVGWNKGKIGDNRYLVDYNDGTIGVNSENSGFVNTNRGTITENKNLIGENEGTVVTNNGGVIKQMATGSVEVCNMAVGENYGRVLEVTKEGTVQYNYNIVEAH